MGWTERLYRGQFPPDIAEPLSLDDYRRVARFRVAIIVILATMNVLLRFNAARQAAEKLVVLDFFLLIALTPQLVSFVMNLAALTSASHDRTWRVVMYVSLTAEVWWVCCAGWIEGTSSGPFPQMVLVIFVYRSILDRRFGFCALLLAIGLHSGLLLAEHTALITSNPLGLATGPTRPGADYPAAKLLWIPATYVIAWLLANHAIVRLRRTQQALHTVNDALKNALGEVSRLARIDPLTQTWNRRYLEERLEAELLRADRLDHEVSLLMLDLDEFKQVNDTHGHAVGDATLVRFAEVLQSHVRAIDIVARYGGEEFVIVLPETESGMAWQVAERIRVAQGAEGLHTTVSIGIADSSHCGFSATRLLTAADAALYRAKNLGKNTVQVAGQKP